MLEVLATKACKYPLIDSVGETCSSTHIEEELLGYSKLATDNGADGKYFRHDRGSLINVNRSLLNIMMKSDGLIHRETTVG